MQPSEETRQIHRLSGYAASKRGDTQRERERERRNITIRYTVVEASYETHELRGMTVSPLETQVLSREAL